MFTTFQAFLMPIIGLNLEGAISRALFKDDDIGNYIGNSILIHLLFSFVTIILVFIFSGFISKLLFIPVNWVIFVPVLCILSFWINLALRLWQMSSKSLKFGVFQIAQSLLNAVLTILLVVILKMNWQGRIIAGLLSVLVMTIYAFFSIISMYKINLKYNKRYFKNALSFGLGILPHSLGVLFLGSISRFFIANKLSIAEAGLFSTAASITSLVSLLFISFNNAYVPWLYGKLTLKDIAVNRKIVKFTYLYFAVIIIIGFLYIISLPLIVKLFLGPSFHESIKYCTWLVIGAVFQGMYFMVTNFIVYAEKTIYQSIITIIVGLVNVALLYALIGRYNITGVGISIVLSNFLFFLFTFLVSARIYKMPWLKANNLKPVSIK
jgi:O-antigen/teichoic acid export membrane protein